MSIKALSEDGALVPAPRNLPTELFLDFDRRDDDAILSELRGAVVEEYVYSFRQGTGTVMGLSLPGVMAVAQQMGGITCGQPIWTITDDDITCDISATDHKVGLTVWGTATAPFIEYDKRDKFARAKALSKAQRNAIRKVIPETVATEMLRMFINGGKPQRPAQPQRQQRQPVIRAVTEIVSDTITPDPDEWDDALHGNVTVTGSPAELEMPATPRQIEDMGLAVKRAGFDAEDMGLTLVQRYGVKRRDRLTVAQANDYLAWLGTQAPEAAQPALPA